MTMVPGASLPSNETVSRGIGVATGCNCESSALANTGPAPALRKRPAAKAAALIRVRRMFPPIDNLKERAATTQASARLADGAIMAQDRPRAMHGAIWKSRIGQLR